MNTTSGVRPASARRRSIAKPIMLAAEPRLEPAQDDARRENAYLMKLVLGAPAVVLRRCRRQRGWVVRFAGRLEGRN
jgi:hypothetical protein